MKAMTASRASLSTRNGSLEAAIASRPAAPLADVDVLGTWQRGELLRKPGHGEPELQLQLLHQAVVQRDRASSRRTRSGTA